MSRPLLSICIPTYNRAKFLRITLDKITSDPDFDSRVEIVISDNCSTDNTQAVGEEFASRFPNVTYGRNYENLGQKNFFKVLSIGSGEYVKLQNDYTYFSPGTLGIMLKEIEKHMESREQIFFCSNTEFHRNETVVCRTADDYMNVISYWVTWISNFGTWRELLEHIDQPYQFTPLRFDQIDWSVQVASMRPTVMLFGRFYDACISDIKKKGYNLTEVFVENFLTILRYHRNKGNITDKAIERAKREVYENLILQYLYYIKIAHTCNLDTKGSARILWRNYGSHLYFYTAPVKMMWKFIRSRFR